MISKSTAYAVAERRDFFQPTLSARLKTLESQGVIGTRLYEKHPPRFEYFLTDKGQALGPVLKALHKWGERHG